MLCGYTEYLKTKRSENTYKACRVSLRAYFVFISTLHKLDSSLVVSSSSSDDKINDLSIFYLESKDFNYFNDLTKFILYMNGSSYSPSSINKYYFDVSYFFKFNDIVLSSSEVVKLKNMLPRNVVIHDDLELTVDMIKSILSHCDVMFRALVLVLVSSGMRIGEVTSIDFSQIKDNEIHMRHNQMKASKPHTYFISSEALEALSEWQKVRDSYLDRSVNRSLKCLGNVKESDNRVFPYSYIYLRNKFKTILEHANLDELDNVSGRSRITFHSFRKFTDSRMNLYIPKNIVNALIGHFELGDSSYRRYPLSQLKEYYSKVEPYLIILAPVDYVESVKDNKSAIAETNSVVVGLVKQIQEQDKRLQEQNNEMSEQKKIIEDSITRLESSERFISYLQSVIMYPVNDFDYKDFIDKLDKIRQDRMVDKYCDNEVDEN